jgi:fructose-bisphosphate aldolase class II
MPLVGTKEMFKKAYEGQYAIGAFNVNNMEIVQGITEAAAALNSPLILQCSAGARKYAKHEYLVHLVQAALEINDIPIALHLDHGADFETCKSCIDGGFTSVMIDGSHFPFKENIELTKKVVDYAHAHNVVVEAELGQLAGIEDDVNVSAENAKYTQPEEVQEFVEKTGVDSLAIAIGTSHGAFKFKPEQCTRNANGVLVPPELRFDILAEIEKRIPEFPIVLHGASSVIPKYVKIINDNGGNLADAVGIPEDQLRKAAKSAVCKINIDSDLRLAMTAGIREHFNAHPEHFDPRQYVADGRSYIKELVEHKIKDVLGSDGRADEIMALLKK